jgi:site-specific DNA recombinase
MKRLAAYCRVSTDRQKDEQTIEVQETFIKEWVSKNDAVIVDWYKDDGWSGDSLERPDLDRLREDANKNIWQGIIFIDRDRLARTLAYQEYVIRELRDKSLEVIFLNNPLADTPLERAMQQVYGIAAEIERINTTERMRKGKIHKAKSGKIVGYSAPYGYRYVLKSGDKDGYFVVNEAETEIVKMIFHWVADEGYSMYKVIQELYARRISPPKKKNEYWRKSTIERLLNRQDYIGITYYNKGMAVVPKHPQNVGGYRKIKKSSRKLKPKEEWIAIPVPATIDKDLFERAHQRLKENLLYNKRNKTYNYFLSGKVYCGCGSKRVGDGVNGHHYYRCAQRIYKFPLPNKCTFEGVNAEILDEMVWTRLLTMLSNPDVIKTQVLRWQKKQDKFKTVFHDEISQAKHALETLKEEEDRYTQAFGSNLITFEKFKELLDSVKAKRNVIETQTKESLEVTQENKISIDNIKTVCKEVMEDLKTITNEKKQKYMRNLIQSIYVKERREALVNGCIPLYTQAQNIQDESISRNCRFTKRGEVDAV